ncbi:MAG TPA: DUF1800 domain-containing protein [Planctomycetota bacterium]|nr:DUF1800 domain-containing protein [Planctomycetota bacterium]
MQNARLAHSIAALTLLAGSALAVGDDDVAWRAAEARHLWNRAGFGARAGQVERAVELGREAQVAELIAGAFCDPFFYEPVERIEREAYAAMDEDGKRAERGRIARENRLLLAQFAGWWVEEMIDGRDPLRERMTLFWHGYFTSSARDVRDSAALIEQNELLREHALGSFGELVKAIVRDPAMLAYLDNDQNRKGNPNENFARELMELFTLGEGNYSEEDVKQAARALTGWTTRRGEPDPRFVPRRHDRGKKSILGVRDDFDADSLVDLLLAQPACPRHLAGRLLEHLEGRAPSAERLTDYAAYLVENDYRIDLFLTRLFNDPDFYRPEVLGDRIASPIDYLVGTARRLGSDPPGELIWIAAGQLGERLLDPPNVKGWEGGRAWITTSTYLQRGNFAGMMLGVVALEDVLADDPELASDEAMMSADDAELEPEMEADASDNQRGPAAARTAKPKVPREMGQVRRILAGTGYRPGVHLSARARRAGAATDVQIVDQLAGDLLAVPLTEEGRATLLEFMARERAALGVEDGRLFGGEHTVEAEKLLRRLAHLILSLPEAQLC